MYRDSPILIFDESTSALDSASESIILDTIYDLDSSITIIMISHKISNLLRCDIVYELINGELAEIEIIK